MARIQDRHPAGAPGPWFVDDRCIDCDAARHVAPGLIERNDGDGVSYFVRQPETPAFPHDLGDGVFRLGHNALDSFGAHSYLVVRDGLNLMIDSPRWTREVVTPVTDLGGIDVVLLSHRDDVADADRYAEHFGADVWIHADDRSAAPYATHLVEGESPIEVAPGVVGFPVPGHTKGSVLWHVDGHLLFSGDSLSWDPQRQQLHAFRRACWFSWEAQTASLARFAESGLPFDRLFCGHGWSHDLDAGEFDSHLTLLVERMAALA